MSAPNHGIPETMTVMQVLDWIAEIFEEPRDHINESTQRDELAGWDSLGHLVLMARLDERFGVRLTDAELAQLKSVADILGILRRQRLLTP